ncbi:leukotriene-B4 omega-hydroxylase 3-like [Saccoglossus kowalevskii]
MGVNIIFDFLSSAQKNVSFLDDFAEKLPSVRTWQVIVVFICSVIVIQAIAIVFKLFKMKKTSEMAFKPFATPSLDIFKSPILGHLGLLSVNKDEIMQMAGDITHEFKYALPLWLGPFQAALICHHPSTVQPILATTEPKDDFSYGMLKPWLGDGLLISSGNKWSRNRKLLTPGFHFDILRPYVKVFNECAITMTDKWSTMCDTGPLEMFQHISLMTLDSLLKCIFSQESHCQTDSDVNPYIKAVYTLTDLIMERINFPPYYSDTVYSLTYEGVKWRKALNDVHNHSRRVIKERKSALKDEVERGTVNKRKYIDFLDILLAAKDEDGNGLTDKEIQDEVDTFMFEGHDTTASGISWCFYNLARHPKYQQMCRDEVDQLLDKKENDELDWDDYAKLPFLTMCIKESLRLHPTVPFVGRRNNKPLTFPELGITIPAGQFLGISVIGLHHNVHLWEEPLVYNPYRFTTENTKVRQNYSFLPFSAGPRNCIGQNFAMNEMKTAIALVLRKFILSVEDDYPVRRMYNVVLRAEEGLHIVVKPREVKIQN